MAHTARPCPVTARVGVEMSDVVIVGSGPTGLMLAGELTLAGVDVAIVERRPTPELVGSRAGGFHARTIEILDQRGIADRFLAEGQVAQAAASGRTMLDFSDFPTRHPYTLGLWQNHIERILLGWVEELGVPIHRGRRGDRLRPGRRRRRRTPGRGRAAPDGVPGRGRRRAQRHPEGGRHRVRRVGRDPEPPDRRGRGDRGDAGGCPPGRHAASTGCSVMEDGRTVRVVVTEQQLGPATEPTLADLGEALTAVFGTDFGIHSPTWISRFTDATRQAAAYRRRAGAAGRGRRAHPLTRGRAGDRPRCAGCGQPRVEARPGGQGRLTRQPPGHLPLRATPGRGPRAEAHDGPVASCSGRRRGSRRCATSSARCWASTSRAG